MLAKDPSLDIATLILILKPRKHMFTKRRSQRTLAKARSLSGQIEEKRTGSMVRATGCKSRE
eukprot:4989100-Pleurochrysis_carterae.AAC.1